MGLRCKRDMQPYKGCIHKSNVQRELPWKEHSLAYLVASGAGTRGVAATE